MRIKGLEIMNDDPADVDVLYAKVNKVSKIGICLTLPIMIYTYIYNTHFDFKMLQYSLGH